MWMMPGSHGGACIVAMPNRHPSRPKPADAGPAPGSSPQPAAPAEPIRPRPAYQVEDPLLAPAEAAAERRQALSTFYRDLKLKRVPAPLYVGPRAPRWRRSVIRAGIDALTATSRASKK